MYGCLGLLGNVHSVTVHTQIHVQASPFLKMLLFKKFTIGSHINVFFDSKAYVALLTKNQVIHIRRLLFLCGQQWDHSCGLKHLQCGFGGIF